MKTKISFLTLLFPLLLGSYQAKAHCEVPCGIYNDQLRVQLLFEHFTTIEKAMTQIESLSQAEEVNYNQLVRWVQTKEEHAVKVQHIVEQYFMHQRIKIKDPSDEEAYQKYITQITLAHQLTVLAMKTKQTTDLENIEKLRITLNKFAKAYFSEEDLKHLEHHNGHH